MILPLGSLTQPTSERAQISDRFLKDERTDQTDRPKKRDFEEQFALFMNRNETKTEELDHGLSVQSTPQESPLENVKLNLDAFELPSTNSLGAQYESSESMTATELLGALHGQSGILTHLSQQEMTAKEQAQSTLSGASQSTTGMLDPGMSTSAEKLRNNNLQASLSSLQDSRQGIAEELEKLAEESSSGDQFSSTELSNFGQSEISSRASKGVHDHLQETPFHSFAEREQDISSDLKTLQDDPVAQILLELKSSPVIEPIVSSPELAPRVVQQVVSQTLPALSIAAPPQETTFTVRLDPPELGEVLIQLKKSEGGIIMRVAAVEKATQLIFEQQHQHLNELLSAHREGLSVELGMDSESQNSNAFQKTADREIESLQSIRFQTNMILPTTPSPPLPQIAYLHDFTA